MLYIMWFLILNIKVYFNDIIICNKAQLPENIIVPDSIMLHYMSWTNI
jgi:hypothetical protein